MPFKSSTCGCCEDKSVLCDTLLCYCFQAARQCDALEGNNDTISCKYCCLGWVCCPFMAACLRCKASDRLQLEETCCTSCICGMFLPLCSVCMTARELNLRGHYAGGCVCEPRNRMLGMH